MWEAVRKLTGRRLEVGDLPGVNAATLNNHYADVSSDTSYQQPDRKLSTCNPDKHGYITEYRVFTILDSLRPTATGLDLLPAWFLRLGAPIIARLFNLSIATSYVTIQWKQACIRPIPKASMPSKCSDLCPIAIMPVLTRVTERTTVTNYLSTQHSSPHHQICPSQTNMHSDLQVQPLLLLCQSRTQLLSC